MNVFTIIVIMVLLSILWLPPLLVAFWLKSQAAQSKTHGLAFVFSIQLVVATSLSVFANYIGMKNPAGYVLGISVAVGLGGAVTLLFWRRSANPALNRTDYKSGPPVS